MSGLILPGGPQDGVIWQAGASDFLNARGRPFPGTFTRNSPAWMAGQQYAANVPRTVDYAGGTLVLVERTTTNLIKNSVMTAAESVTTTAQTYTLSVRGTGSVTMSGTATGTATAGNPRTVTATAGTLTLTPSGSVQAQLEVGPFATSYIPTTGAAVTRQADRWSSSTVITPARPWTLALAAYGTPYVFGAAVPELFSLGGAGRSIPVFIYSGNALYMQTYGFTGGSVSASSVATPPGQSVRAYLVHDGRGALTLYGNAQKPVTLTVPLNELDATTSVYLGGYSSAEYEMNNFVSPGAPALAIPFVRPWALTAAEIAAEDARWKAALDAVTLPAT